MTSIKQVRGVTRRLRLLVPFTFICLALICLAFLTPGCNSKSPRLAELIPAPETISITAGDETITLSWAPLEGATGYNAYWAMAPGVTKTTGTLMADVTSPFVHEGLTNGQTYYYVLTALYGSLESGESPEMAAVPRPPAPDIPQGVTASVAPEQPNATLVEWESVDGATSYNLYWNNEGDVSTDDNVFNGAVSPFVHTALAGGTPYYYRVSALNGGSESGLSSEVMATPRGPAEPHGGDEGLGNNLSYPVVFADGYGMSGLLLGDAEPPWLEFNTGLRPSATEVTSDTVYPIFDPTTVYLIGDTEYYEQKTISTWQASWVNGFEEEGINVRADWGDNIWAQHFTTNSVIRIENILFQTPGADPESAEYSDPTTAYEMELLYGSGTTEQQGTNTLTYAPPTRHIFSILGRLRIEKLLSEDGEPDATVPAIDKSVWESFGSDGPGGYGAEVNVGGKVVYGYVWFLNKSELSDSQKVGWWRITFSLDDDCDVGGTTVTNKTTIISTDPSDADAVFTSQSTSIKIYVEQK